MKAHRSFVALALTASLGLAACGEEEEPAGGGGGAAASQNAAPKLSGTIAGAGSSAQDAAMQAWIAGFQEKNPDATISYDPVGSGGGREQFVSGGVAFGGSDAALEGEELAAAQKRCGKVVELPGYVSPIAIVYNLEGVDNLQLSPETVAGIFKQEITNFNDPAIAKDNPGTQLPDQRITPVNRSDESGTTENFVEYLSATAPDVWDFEVSGDWPVKGGEAADGTSGVVEAVGAGKGTIGYADASQAGDLGVAKIKVGEEYVAPSPEAAAAILEASKRSEKGGEFSFAYDLERDTTEAGTYPIVLLSYEIACANYENKEEADLVKGFFNYIISPEGQQAAAKNAGSAPITDQLRSQLQPAVDAIKAGSAG